MASDGPPSGDVTPLPPPPVAASPPTERTALLSAKAREREPLPPRPAAPPSRGWWSPERVGLALMAVSTLGFSTMTLLVRVGGTALGLPSLQLVVSRSVVQAGLAGALLGATRTSLSLPRPGLWGLTLARSLSGTVGIASFFAALQLLPLGDATVIFFTGPLWTAALAAVALGEPVARLDIAAAVVCLAGVAAVAHASGGGGGGGGGGAADTAVAAALPLAARLTGVGLSLLGAVSSAVSYVIVRHMGAAVPAALSVAAFGVTASVVGVAGMAATGTAVVVPANPLGWFITGGVGVCAFGGSMALTAGLQRVPAGIATIVRYVDVALAYAYGVVLLGEVPTPLGAGGAAAIVVAAAAVGVRRALRSP
ncbi:hypothetical protein I4F81_005934 [Pyropia yezoensis]|uniref:Uncharacterized protein n=1 Tax=Pyropia yezoensis TaxID=2788 RepID=A0ACC3BZT9_PYRYE|nr:hypothetical protein I4F81_005934 [Neopyropia yezoensis]